MSDYGGADSGGEGTDTTRRAFVKAVSALSALAAGSTGGIDAAFGREQSDLESLVAEMTLEQKALRTHGSDVEDAPEGIAGNVAGIGELDVPQLNMADGPPGASIGRSATDFPHPIATASTFDPSLVARAGAAIAREAKAWGVDVLLGPSMDTFRVPYHSRSGETYGEDPHLAAEMAAAYTGAVQDEDVIATPKHFAAYNQSRTTGQVADGFSISEHNVVVDERTLREIYFRPFRAAVRDGGAGAIMPAYNRINGTFCSEHYLLLRDVLKDDWGFDGFAVSDWFGTHSTVQAAVNGLDVEMPSAQFFGQELQTAVENDDLNEDVVDEMVLRGLRSQQEIGALDGDREGVGDTSVIGAAEHADLAEQIAEAGSVLLKNEGLLPLSEDDVDSVALIGPSPGDFKQDVGGSDAIEAVRRVGLQQGIEAVSDDGVTVETTSTDRPELVTADDGFSYEYYDSQDLSGDPIETGSVESIDVAAPESGEESPFSSARWTGTVTPDESGVYGLAFVSGGQAHVSVDGERVGYNEPPGFVPFTERSSVELEAGTEYEITFEVLGGAPARLEWNPPAGVSAAADAAANSDVAVFLAETYTGYGDDRYQFPLTGDQNAAIEAAAEANEDTVVLLNAEAPVGMPWVDAVPAVMQVWFPGQEAGTAVANLLFGNANPSGKSPVTFARSGEDYLPTEVNTLPDEGRGYPGVSGNVYYDEGVFVGYRHFDEHDVEPLFPFGHGESYTEFEYSNVRVRPKSVKPDDGVSVEVDVTNAGDRDGAETVQVYVGEVDPAVERPPKELKGFAKVDVAAGETETASVDLGREAFQYWDPDAEDWLVDGGEYRVLVGASSRDIRHEATVRVRPDRGRDTGGGDA